MNRRRSDEPVLFESLRPRIDPGPPHENKLGCPCRLCCRTRAETAANEAAFVAKHGMSSREHNELIKQRAEQFRRDHPWRPS